MEVTGVVGEEVGVVVMVVVGGWELGGEGGGGGALGEASPGDVPYKQVVGRHSCNRVIHCCWRPR